MLPNNVFNGFLSGFLYSVVAFIACILLYAGATKIQSKYYPMLSGVHIEFVSHDEEKDLSNITLYFDKKYECRPLLNEFAWYVSQDFNNTLYYDRIYFEIPTTKGSVSRPVGSNISENWLINYKEGYETFKKPQKLIFKHSCFGFLKIKTVIDIPSLFERKISISGL